MNLRVCVQSISEWEGWPILISTVYVHSDCDAVLPIAEFFLGKYLASSRVQCHISLFCLINWILSSRKGQQLMQSEWSEKCLSWFVFGTLLLEVHTRVACQSHKNMYHQKIYQCQVTKINGDSEKAIFQKNASWCLKL